VKRRRVANAAAEEAEERRRQQEHDQLTMEHREWKRQLIETENAHMAFHGGAPSMTCPGISCPFEVSRRIQRGNEN
jgi:hypothetical protein